MLNMAQNVSLIYVVRGNFGIERHAEFFSPLWHKLRKVFFQRRFYCSLPYRKTCSGNAIRIASLFSVTDSSAFNDALVVFVCYQLHNEREIDDKWKLSFVLLHTRHLEIVFVEARNACWWRDSCFISIFDAWVSAHVIAMQGNSNWRLLYWKFLQSEGVLNFMDDREGRIDLGNVSLE